MSFEITDQHISDFSQLGFTIFRGLIEPKLLAALRIESEKARVIARKRSGDQAQRLQPLAQFSEINMGPFDEYQNLPALQRALDRLFEAGFGFKPNPTASRDVLGILLEPAAQPWSIAWHRDWRDNIPGLDLDAWDKVKYNIRYFNQVNCALYQDGSTWVVPGSHLREDTDAEILFSPKRPVTGAPNTSGLTPEEAEVAGIRYARSMPGAVQANLNAGDYLLYRNSLWHHGCYINYCKRATLHDGLFTPEFEAFFKNPPYRIEPDGKRANTFANPNLNTLAYKQWAAKQ